MTHAILTHSYCSDFYAEHGYQFLKQVAQDYSVPPNLVIFSVMHCYEGSLPYINVLAQLAHPLVFIPKNATADANPELLKTINQIANCQIVNPSYNKESLRDPLHCEALIRQYISHDSPFLILDHGGYFANASEHLCHVFQQQLVGITELTANGLYKYCNKNINKPLVTVSHLSIKTPADTEASECIVHYSDQILREEFGLKINNAGFLRMGVVGAGNLGRGIIKHLQNKDICNIHVFDQDPRRLTQFPRDGVNVCSLEYLIQQCNMVFCCTGNGALTAEIFDHLTQPLFITTVTSADDELRLPELVTQGVLTEISSNQLVKEYQTRNGVCVYLLAGGESANTPFKTGMGDPTLYLFEAAHMLAGLQLLNQPQQFTDGIQALSDNDEIMIAQQWLTHFYNYQ
ncbi:S-adenosyl-L-homocysteine hydrolase [Photobacterium kishitanii]|uniref:S-adenosyl-L-homocysteine hydrolase n=1 Tax=Photobacterium kishitanii TaxID=318456 RepID=A0AAX0YNR0_9GAMM|nr:NAD(P)-binding domain-containing protein [Photobacterium kishitanii]KJG55083.1 S-adenosyl-L-homocysteine hydrolase [Photobacterium kishitanii]KJG56993.1 S-adenosyl-L-homocysteine hydrolase [Photobacterium kishitanii]KJG63450.1 S-adenosyl-L-homocysteine hydrolase [Photobacterium kishitanii]KJG65647.1 S-adenosyl-L-homocysteine hydrolase [Photobacterium kishitanii]OBU31010.1 S-adenosyl-L-homocysteine hydrolase [Photobacterium kishitanii]